MKKRILIILSLIILLILIFFLGDIKDLINSRKIKEEEANILLKLIEDNNLNYLDQYNETFPDMNKLNNQLKLELALQNLKENDDLETGVSKNIIENIVTNIFGPNTSFKHENYLCSYCEEIYIKYENNTYKYDIEHGGHGADTFITHINKYLSGRVKNDLYIIDVAKLISFSFPDQYVYTDIADYNNPKKAVIDRGEDYLSWRDITSEDFEKIYPLVKDKITKYRYTFKKVNSNYYLIKYEIIRK